MKRLSGLLTAFCLLLTVDAHASTGCSYPSSLDSWVDKIANDFLTIADVNQFRCAIEKIEAELGTLPKGSYATVVARLNALIDSNGKSGGQSIIGGSAAGEDLSLASTVNATKGSIFLGSASVYDEANDRLGIGTQAPGHKIQAQADANVNITAQAAGASVVPAFNGVHARGTNGSPTATQANDVLAALTGQGRGATGYGGPVAAAWFRAAENFTDSAQGTYFGVGVTPSGSTTLLNDHFTFSALGLRLGATTGTFADTSLHVAGINNVAAATYEESTATPANPSDGAQLRVYFKADKIVFQFNEGGTVRYKYLDLTGTGVTWVHTTTAP